LLGSSFDNRLDEFDLYFAAYGRRCSVNPWLAASRSATRSLWHWQADAS